mmetsp:Transcript_31196/g.71212  ORF Transcript_31196/g.71212 Transcript_31196/m.71212 type:complete len:160 (-) Transcript_31196:79-558(-)
MRCLASAALCSKVFLSIVVVDAVQPAMLVSQNLTQTDLSDKLEVPDAVQHARHTDELHGAASRPFQQGDVGHDMQLKLPDAPGQHETCGWLLGLNKFAWAIVCDVLALALVILCVPLLLTCSRRRPPGAPLFDCNCWVANVLDCGGSKAAGLSGDPFRP